VDKMIFWAHYGIYIEGKFELDGKILNEIHPFSAHFYCNKCKNKAYTPSGVEWLVTVPGQTVVGNVYLGHNKWSESKEYIVSELKELDKWLEEDYDYHYDVGEWVCCVCFKDIPIEKYGF
jgi:hypothetical protein